MTDAAPDNAGPSCDVNTDLATDASAEASLQQPRAWWRSRRWLVTAGAGVAAIFVIVTLVLVNRVDVPDLTGLSAEAAEEELRAAGLGLDFDETDWYAGVGRLFQVVESQSPAPGETVWRNADVQLDMVPMEVTLPDVTTMTFATASDLLAGQGLSIAAEFDAEPAAAGWLVLEQQPRAGSTVRAGDEITVLLDVPEVEVPALVGFTLANATAALQAIGLGIQPDSVSAEADWEVVGQGIPPGGTVRFGDSVEVEVLPPLIEVPDVVGLTQSQAQRTLEAAGFTVTVRPESFDSDWKVSTQAPAAGAQAREGSAVTVTLREPRIVFSVSGNGTRALITWTVPGGSFSIGQENNARLPWSISFPMTSGYKGNLSAQMLNGSSITCTITVDGRVTSSITSTGQFSIAMCG